MSINKKSTIRISDIRCYAYHGCMEEEGKIGGNYIVDVIFEADLSKAIQGDDLSDTIDYVTVYRLVKEEMAIRSRLIEHVAGRILIALLNKFQFVSKVTVELKKINPPVNGTLGSATVVVSGGQ